MLKKLFRALTVLCGVVVGYGITSYTARPEVLGEAWGMRLGEKILWIISGMALFGFIFNYLFSVFQNRGERAAKKLDMRLKKIPAIELVYSAAGLVVGFLIAFLVSQIYNQIRIMSINVILSVATYLVLGALGINVGRRLGSDTSFPLFDGRFIAKEKTTKEESKEEGVPAPKIFDTSVIIDGRIPDIMKTGFLEGTYIIPDFILVELRHIADSSDPLKRNRGRRGLDVLNRIQSDYGIEIYDTSKEKSLADIHEVDVKLLKLARIMDGAVVTNDYNLNKVATISGIKVLNINELANTLKPVVLPGEEMEIFIVKEGKENDQGVAYLDDGTMIVVENGKKFIGKSIRAMVTSVLQTAAGRMIFAKPAPSS